MILEAHRGRSDRPEIGLTLNRFAVDLRELIDYLKLENIVLAGWSMGASTIFEYAKIYGVEKLQGIILFDMTPKFINDDTWNLGLYNGNYKIENALVDLITMCGNLKDFLEIFFKKVAPYMTDYMLSASIETAMSNTPHILYAMWLAMASNDYRGILGRLTIPTVIAYGTNESLYSTETACFLNSKIPNSKIVPFENCTHLLVRENPKKATEVIEELSQIVFR